MELYGQGEGDGRGAKGCGAGTGRIDTRVKIEAVSGETDWERGELNEENTILESHHIVLGVREHHARACAIVDSSALVCRMRSDRESAVFHAGWLC